MRDIKTYNLTKKENDMAKVTRVYEGINDNGLPVMVALDTDGNYWHRVKDFNGFSNQWQAWQHYTPSWNYTTTDPTMQYGTKLLKEITPPPRLRLPKSLIA